MLLFVDLCSSSADITSETSSPAQCVLNTAVQHSWKCDIVSVQCISKIMCPLSLKLMLSSSLDTRPGTYMLHAYPLLHVTRISIRAMHWLLYTTQCHVFVSTTSVRVCALQQHPAKQLLNKLEAATTCIKQLTVYIVISVSAHPHVSRKRRCWVLLLKQAALFMQAAEELVQEVFKADDKLKAYQEDIASLHQLNQSLQAQLASCCSPGCSDKYADVQSAACSPILQVDLCTSAIYI